MNEQPRRTLKRLISQYGQELVQDPRRTEAFLNDLCGQFRREIFVLVNAQRQRVPVELLNTPRWMPRHAVRARLISQLQEKLAITEDAAIWAVDAWAYALDLADQPEPTKRRNWFGASTSKSTTTPHSVNAPSPLAQPASTGVQYQPESVPPSSRPSAQSHAKQRQPTASAQHWRFMAREPLAYAIVWAAVLGFSIALLWAMFTESGANTLSAGSFPGFNSWTNTNSRSPVTDLEEAYPLPQLAFINAISVNVRQGTSTQDEVVGQLTGGTQNVTVVEYSADGRWSRIETPQQGWVSNDFIYFNNPHSPGNLVRLGIDERTVSAVAGAIYSGPGANFNQTFTIGMGEKVVLIASTADGSWVQVSWPASGWIATAELQPPAN
jgi:uncharacterized protein YraI